MKGFFQVYSWVSNKRGPRLLIFGKFSAPPGFIPIPPPRLLIFRKSRRKISKLSEKFYFFRKKLDFYLKICLFLKFSSTYLHFN